MPYRFPKISSYQRTGGYRLVLLFVNSHSSKVIHWGGALNGKSLEKSINWAACSRYIRSLVWVMRTRVNFSDSTCHIKAGLYKGAITSGRNNNVVRGSGTFKGSPKDHL